MSNVSRQPASGGMLRLLIIDRYLLRQFLQTFMICFFSLTGLYVVIDGFANLEEFIEYGRKQGGLLKVMGEYYAYRSLSFFDTMSPILTLISAMFTVTWIQRHNELTAIEAAGIPKSRVIRPVIVAAVAIALLGALINRELIIPRVRHHLSHNAQALGGNTAKALIPRYDNETDILLGSSASKTYSVEQRIHRPDFYMPPGLDRYGPRVTAENAYFRPPQDGRPGGYLFKQVELPESIATLPSLSLYGRKVLLTPHDTDWLAPDECFIASNLSFEYLDGGAALRQYSSTFELVRGLRNRSLDFGADERLAIHARFVQPVQDLTLLFLGLPLVLSRSNRNVFFAIGLCLALVVAFSAIVIGSRYLGSSYWLEPALGAWLPLMIFIPCAVALSGPFRE